MKNSVLFDSEVHNLTEAAKQIDLFSTALSHGYTILDEMLHPLTTLAKLPYSAHVLTFY